MEYLFKMTQAQLKKHLAKRLKRMGRFVFNNGKFVYSPGKHPVLIVAHMDTVHNEPEVICKSPDGNVWMSPTGIGGDDRNGVYMALEVLKEIDCHVLFCEDEEVGGIGASDFVKSGHKLGVNFIVEFDRRGNNDCVFYNCANYDFEEYVESFGFKTAHGTFSDISVLAPALGVAAVNLSAGYYGEHTHGEYIVWSDIRNILKRAKELIAGGTARKFEYVETKSYYKNAGNLSYLYDDMYDDDRFDFNGYYDYPQKLMRPVAGVFEGKNGDVLESDIDYTFYVDAQGNYYCDFGYDEYLVAKVGDNYVPVKGMRPTVIGGEQLLSYADFESYMRELMECEVAIQNFLNSGIEA